MSSVPSEVLRDVLRPLDRWTLDDVQFTDRRFLRLITERMSDVCRRQVNSAHFDAPHEQTVGSWSYAIRIDSRPERKNAHKNTDHLFSEFVRALRSSRIAYFILNGHVFSPERAALVLQTPIVAGALTLGGSCADLTATQFQQVLVHFGPTSVNLAPCHVRACQITDGLLRALIKKGTRNMLFPIHAPVDGGNFPVTDDAIVDFVVQENAQIGQEGGAAARPILYEQLDVSNGRCTKDLFKRLVEASFMSTRTLPLRITVSPARFEEEDLRDFAQHLSYRRRGTPHEERIYDFPVEHQGADAAMRLQIVLSKGNRLELFRAHLPNFFFHKSDE
ncbi:hypothetical protein AAVH_09502 [Aphelenchoides avenae]|nr:hypothetical protein AAVH_09502 [Aphelenchus avenae]